MDERNWVIADIPVGKGLGERYCVHINAAIVHISKCGKPHDVGSNTTHTVELVSVRLGQNSQKKII